MPAPRPLERFEGRAERAFHRVSGRASERRFSRVHNIRETKRGFAAAPAVRLRRTALPKRAAAYGPPASRRPAPRVRGVVLRQARLLPTQNAGAPRRGSVGLSLSKAMRAAARVAPACGFACKLAGEGAVRAADPEPRASGASTVGSRIALRASGMTPVETSRR